MKACLGLFGMGVSAVCFLQYGVLRGEGECDDPGRKEGEREGKQYGLKVGGRVDNSEHVFLMHGGGVCYELHALKKLAQVWDHPITLSRN